MEMYNSQSAEEGTNSQIESERLSDVSCNLKVNSELASMPIDSPLQQF